MIETAENLRREYGISRTEQDELAVSSHTRAVTAQKNGILAEEIVPVTVRSRAGEQVIDTDEHPRPDISLESLAALKPILGKTDPESTVTAGNASGQNDAAAMCFVTTMQTAERLGLRPLVRMVSWGAAGVAPKIMGIGPVPATEVALRKAGLALSDIDLIELNEAFAAQALAVMREWDFGAADLDRTNVHGSGISSVILSVRRVYGCWQAWPGNWIAVTRGTGSRRCASVVGRAWPQCSNEWRRR